MDKKIAPFLLFYALSLGISCNVLATSGSLSDYLNLYIDNIPGNSGNNYSQPSLAQLDNWASTVNNILDHNIVAANSIATNFNYQVIEFTDTSDNPGQLYYILEEQLPRTYFWGTYIFNSNPCRADLNIQAPHPKSDLNTGKQAVYCFTQLNAKSLFISGTHRCNHSTHTTCDGNTSVCSGSSSSYSLSDMAHNTTSTFQKTTATLMSKNSNAVFIQFHGFAKKSTDPFVIMSNGTRDTPVVDYITQLQHELKTIDSSLTFKIGHVDLTWNRLLGFTNTQGRLLNGSISPCDIAASNATGGFIHLEQEKSKLRNDSTGWNKVYTSLSNVFKCTHVGTALKTYNSTIKIYPNPVNNNLVNIVGNGILHIKISDLSGKVLKNDIIPNSMKVTYNLPLLDAGIYIIAIKTIHNRSHHKLIIN